MAAPTPHSALELDFAVVVEAPPPTDLRLADLEPLAAFVLNREGARGAWTLAVALVADDRLQALHRDFMGIDEPTDVMTFPASDEGGGGGDIVISVDRATAQAGEWNHTPAVETLFLLVHGLLHLCGWDDSTPEDRARMLARQHELLNAFAKVSENPDATR